MFFSNDPQFQPYEQNLSNRNELLARLEELGLGGVDTTAQTNADRMRLATAGTQTAFGDSLTYDPTLNRWNINLNPGTKSLIGAQRGEQLRSLTLDAPRNRAAAERRDARSIAAEDEFGQAFNRFKYRPELNEDAYVGQAQRDALLSNREASDEVAAAINRSLMRGGGTADIGRTFRDANDALSDRFAGTLANARDTGRSRYASDLNRELQSGQSELGTLRGIADDTIQSPVQFGNDADLINSLIQRGGANISDAFNQNAAASSAATQQLMQILQLILTQTQKR